MSNYKTDKPELLAPAGNLDCALAAFQSGADAVYAGISRFNAREMGENFSRDDMSRLSVYSKKNNKRFYLTLNTLVKEHELQDFGEEVSRIAKLAPDAVIVQDIGVIRFLREYFPGLTIHSSTQMGIHNSAGVKAAAAMGVERVILERQVTLEELKKICKVPVEIEVFIHGALCCSISGHCLFSSWLGGWSGNRGRCKQPCRRRFHGEEDGQRKSGFFFSTQDLYSLDILDELAVAGVRSLKIEGRLKKPDYVKNVVTAYRMMLDSPASDKPSVLKEARSILAGSYGRKWSHGFSASEDMKELINYSSAGVSGRLAGAVEKTSKKGFEASVIQRLHTGDRIRIQPRSGDEGPSITITKMSVDRKSVKSASKGTRVFIHCDKEVSERSMIYKIGESRAETVKRPGELPLYSAPLVINLNIKASSGGLTVSVAPFSENGNELIWQDKTPIEPASNQPLKTETLVEAFRSTRNESITAAELTAETEDGLFLPAGRLKKTRRTFYEWFEIQPEVQRALEDKTSENHTKWNSRLNSDRDSFRRSTPSCDFPVSTLYPGKNGSTPTRGAAEVQVVNIFDFVENPSKWTKTGIELILPFFCPEKKLESLSSMIVNAIENGVYRFRVTSIYQLELLKELLQAENIQKELILCTSFPLPAANSLAAKELEDFGVSKAQIWLELEEAAIKAAAENWPAIPEIYRKGKPFLLATRASVSISGRITDSRGKGFYVKQPPLTQLDASAELAFVFPEEVLSLPPVKGAADYYELAEVSGDEKETVFNYDFSLI